MAWELSPERSKRLDEIVTHYPSPMAALLPALRLVQEEVGWISKEGMAWVAKRLDVPLSHVQGVVSFYTLFHEEPTGKWVIQVCRTLSCSLGGSEKLLAHCQKKLGIGVGETKGDFTLETAECLASCGTAPVVSVNDQYHEGMTPEKLDALIEELKSKR